MQIKNKETFISLSTIVYYYQYSTPGVEYLTFFAIFKVRPYLTRLAIISYYFYSFLVCLFLSDIPDQTKPNLLVLPSLEIVIYKFKLLPISPLTRTISGLLEKIIEKNAYLEIAPTSLHKPSYV